MGEMVKGQKGHVLGIDIVPELVDLSEQNVCKLIALEFRCYFTNLT